MSSLVVLVPGDLESRTGGYGYDRRIIEGLRARGWSVSVRALDVSFPFPTRTAREHAARVLAEIPDASLVLVDGLAFGAMAEEAERERQRLRMVALVHHPLGAETGIPIEQSVMLEKSERVALASARLVVVTSRATMESLAAYRVPPDRIVVVEPGTDRRSLARGSRDGTVHVLCVASLVPRKGHETLIDALVELSDLDWRLTCVGSPARHPQTVRRLEEKVAAAGLADRVTLAGELGEADLAASYDAADVFVLPTFHEGYGMVVAEALAHGLPVVSTPTGAIPDLVGADAGILVPAGDVMALAEGLRRVMSDRTLRAHLAEGARYARDRLPTWDAAAAAMAAALEGVPGRG